MRLRAAVRPPGQRTGRPACGRFTSIIWNPATLGCSASLWILVADKSQSSWSKFLFSLIRRHRPVRQVRSAPQHGHAAGQTASLSAPRNLLVQALHQACVACQVGFLPTAGSDATARGSSGGSGAGSDSALYQCAPVETTTMMSWNSLDSNG